MNDIPVNHPTNKLRRQFPSRLAKRIGLLWLVTSWCIAVAVVYVANGDLENFPRPYSAADYYLPYFLIAYFYVFVTIFRRKIMNEYHPGKGSPVNLFVSWKKLLCFWAYMWVVSGFLAWSFGFAIRLLIDALFLFYSFALFSGYVCEANKEASSRNLLWKIRERTNPLIANIIFHSAFAALWYWCAFVTNNELTVGVLHVVAINLLLGVKNHGEK